ncbi:MAG: NAD(P)-binding domain-containing protein, partial [Lachnospiraceae bacterium]|nr:NAD(P)-binding domain-containing protein [Lachnospiraceae bacterium]
MKIGFIGMGIMGKPMAMNLLKAGYDVTVSNRSMDKCAPLVEAGAKAGTYAEVAESCDTVITMLPNGPQVKAVMLGENGVGAKMKAGSTFIDMSSINPVDS